MKSVGRKGEAISKFWKSASRKGQAAKDLFWPLGQKNIYLG